MKTQPSELTASRGSTHGPADKQFCTAQDLKEIIRSSADEAGMVDAVRRESLEMICVKMSRIIWGNSHEPDHWDDIMGYAFLGQTGGKNG